MSENGVNLSRHSPPPLQNTDKIRTNENTPTACSDSNETVPGTIFTNKSDDRRRSPRLLSAVIRNESTQNDVTFSGDDGVIALESPPTRDILSQNGYSQPSSSLGSSLNTGSARRSLSSVVNDDNFGMDLSAKNFACCFSDSDEEGGFDKFSPLIDNDDSYLDDEADNVMEEFVEIYENIETSNVNSSSINSENECNCDPTDTSNSNIANAIPVHNTVDANE